MSAALLSKSNLQDGDSRQSKGQISRATILLAAAKLATTKGLGGLSIGGLAAEVGMSKSGLYAHFKSKEDLELATVELAASIFEEGVMLPASKIPAGMQRLRAAVAAFLAYLERRVFPGGCFFAAVALQLDTRPGPARDKVMQVLGKWLSLLRQGILDGQALGEVDADIDVDQAVFEIEAMTLAANFLFVMSSDIAHLQQSNAGIENILERIAAKPANKKQPTPRNKRSN